MRLHGLFRWLLGQLCRNAGIDRAYIDSELTYWENKENLQRLFPNADLRLPKDWSKRNRLRIMQGRI